MVAMREIRQNMCPAQLEAGSRGAYTTRVKRIASGLDRSNSVFIA